MPKIAKLKRKIRSVSSLERITNTLYKLSLSYVSYWRKTIEEVKSYYRRFLTTILLSRLELIPELKRLKPPPAAGTIVLIWSPTQGLCGTLESRLKSAIKNNATLLKNSELIILINKKLTDFVISITQQKTRYKIFSIDSYDKLNKLSESTHHILDLLKKHIAKQIIAIYPFYQGSFSYTIKIENIDIFSNVTYNIELLVDQVNNTNTLDVPPEDAINTLVEFHLYTSLLVRSIHLFTSEHVERMRTLKNASDNASKLKHKLELMYNRERQDNITYELLDIINAKRAIEL